MSNKILLSNNSLQELVFRFMKFAPLTFLLLCFCLFSGCGKMPATVSGKLTLDGQALPNADISFRPTAAGVSMAHGRSDASGNYQLNTGTESGLTPGTYQVTVIATEIEANAAPNADPIPKVLTPAKYQDPETSGLTAEVKDGRNTHNFDLKSTP